MWTKHMKRTTSTCCLLLIGVLGGCAVRAGDRAPDWTLRDLTGRAHSMSDYAGKVVVLDFWATWCAPCMIVSPHMQMLHEKYSDRGVAVLAVHYDKQGEPTRYMTRNGYTFTVLDDGLDVAKRHGVSKIPTLMVVGPDGRVVYRQTGFATGDEEELIRIIEKLLNR